jgi:hypothetical protein
MLASTKSYSGKAGLAAAGWIMAAGTAFVAGPAAFIASAAFMYTMPRIMRSRAILKFLTNPRTNARIYNTAKELGVDVGDNKWLMSQVAQETIPLEVRNIINNVVRQWALQYTAEGMEDNKDRARQVISRAQNSNIINNVNSSQIRAPSETITQETIDIQPSVLPPIISRSGDQILRQIEEEKLLGLRN